MFEAGSCHFVALSDLAVALSGLVVALSGLVVVCGEIVPRLVRLGCHTCVMQVLLHGVVRCGRMHEHTHQ